jgi:hypothetical protein
MRSVGLDTLDAGVDAAVSALIRGGVVLEHAAH